MARLCILHPVSMAGIGHAGYPVQCQWRPMHTMGGTRGVNGGYRLSGTPVNGIASARHTTWRVPMSKAYLAGTRVNGTPVNSGVHPGECKWHSLGYAFRVARPGAPVYPGTRYGYPTVNGQARSMAAQAHRRIPGRRKVAADEIPMGRRPAGGAWTVVSVGGDG